MRHNSGQSRLEQLPPELLRMVVLEATNDTPATSIVLKLISKTLNAAMKKEDGTALVKFTVPARGECALSLSCTLDEVQRKVEAGWHRQSLASFYCTGCCRVKERSVFPDSQRSRRKSNRLCLPCGLQRRKLWRTTSVKLDGILWNQCSRCKITMPADERRNSFDYYGNYNPKLCIDCYAPEVRRKHCITFAGWHGDWQDIEARFDLNKYIETEGRVEAFVDGSSVQEILALFTRGCGGKNRYARLFDAGWREQEVARLDARDKEHSLKA